MVKWWSDIFIQPLEFLHPPNFDYSLKYNLAILLHIDDYDVPSVINVFELKFLPIVDHSLCPNSNVVVVDFETFHDAIDYDSPFGDFNAKSWFFEINEFKLNNVNKAS
jgi:hypothetical protein